MAEGTKTFTEGLEGVVAAKTHLSKIDGEKGALSYCGYDIKDLAEHSSFEEVSYLLLHRELPSRDELIAWEDELCQLRKVEPRVLDLIRKFPKQGAPMAVLRTFVSALSIRRFGGEDAVRVGEIGQGKQLLAQAPVLVAEFDRYRRGLEPLDPLETGGTAHNFLYLLRGKEPTQEESRMLDQYLILAADHGLNASTFTARVIAATLSDLYSAVTGAIGALKGDLHGGAARRANEMLKEVGSPEKVELFIDRMLDHHEKVMGFGHRVYKAYDPRAKILKRAVQERTKKSSGLLKIAEAVEKEIWEKKELYPNVDFYTAVLLDELGLQNDLFTLIFSMSRMAGWVAHVIEQHEDNRLIRPKSEYIGPASRKYTPVNERKPKVAS